MMLPPSRMQMLGAMSLEALLKESNGVSGSLLTIHKALRMYQDFKWVPFKF